MKAINTGNSFQLYDDSVKTYDSLPSGTYSICFSQNRGFFLEKINNFSITEKIYGSHQKKVEKVFRTYNMTNRNLGVILSGDKGIGKSLFAKMLCLKGIEEGLPLIIVDCHISGIANFINSIEQKCIVLFDEFDKTFCGTPMSKDTMNDPQTEMLTLFDGINTSEKLFVITCNDINKLSEFLVNRPGRFHYHFRFDYPSAEEITAYLKDNIDRQFWGEIEDVVSFATKVKLTYDCLRAIAFEINNGETFKSAIDDLNIINFELQNYQIEIIFSDGYVFSTNINFDAFSNKKVEINVSYKSFYDILSVSFNPSDIQYDKLTGKSYIAEENIHCEWDIEGNGYNEESPILKNLIANKIHPEKMLLTRNYKNKQYQYTCI